MPACSQTTRMPRRRLRLAVQRILPAPLSEKKATGLLFGGRRFAVGRGESVALYITDGKFRASAAQVEAVFPYKSFVGMHWPR